MFKASVLILALMFAPYAGTGQPIERRSVPFDITFWQKELRLTKAQRLQIYCINRCLYNSIYEMVLTDSTDHHNLQMLLDLWKHSTFDLLSQKQKRRWKKLERKYYGVEDSPTVSMNSFLVLTCQ